MDYFCYTINITFIVILIYLGSYYKKVVNIHFFYIYNTYYSVIYYINAFRSCPDFIAAFITSPYIKMMISITPSKNTNESISTIMRLCYVAVCSLSILNNYKHVFYTTINDKMYVLSDVLLFHQLYNPKHRRCLIRFNNS